MIIDFHTHIFPDHVAGKAVPHLAREGNVEPRLDGTMRSLTASMDRHDISASVACMIATRPAQFDSIFSWCRDIASERIIPFPSVHPDDPNCVKQIQAIADAGFSGIKMHPYYQNFALTDDKMTPVYAELERLGLILLMHTGFDVAFPRTRLADPEKIVTVCARFPELSLVASHLGAWELWPEVRTEITGRKIYMDTSYALNFCDRELARQIILNHPAEYVLFGSDSPWEDQAESLGQLRGLDLPPGLFSAIAGENARRLLGLDG